MLKLIISGANGHMGRAVARLAAENPDVEIAAGVDLCAERYGAFPVFIDPMEFYGKADALIDFSAPAALDMLLRYSAARKVPLVR
ncbi:MAG: 4-hydroxy-tetrahydrodipicolinate reductase, partial [Oscillospiraceae bacterium]|nr:4-hydroxy-tetrahydrodipicolinate reductase [Oscillospiraceae bacterium]